MFEFYWKIIFLVGVLVIFVYQIADPDKRRQASIATWVMWIALIVFLITEAELAAIGYDLDKRLTKRIELGLFVMLLFSGLIDAWDRRRGESK